ncbi:pentatricopeptide repeat-containing protein At5g66520-like [Humulus lupulus]|uniref:pentatricopeptide repeat-containing protein At5g66520-like n=1 Tax=Humulus lupulus TaxID=3486 RepID=UPI002B40BE63|nr:pentatricopeptide repeat-containing protein At5g66520-like [Humulus lupulus]
MIQNNHHHRIVSLSQKCKTLNQLKQIHAHLIKSFSPENPFALAPVLSAAATFGDASFFSYALSIFDHLRHRRNVFMFNSMIRGFVRVRAPLDTVLCYLDMLAHGLAANHYTFPPLMKACTILIDPDSKLIIGRLVHAHVVKFGFRDDPFVNSALIEFYSSVCEMGLARFLFDKCPKKDVVLWTTMIDGYGKMGDVEKARELFDEMPQRNAISWSAMMAAYSRLSNFKEVLCLFGKMQEAAIRPNESVLVTVLTASTRLGAVTQGLWIHSYAKRNKLDSNPILATALVDMYSKCGLLESALAVFKGISSKHAEAWNAIITGLSLNGNARKSLHFFEKMTAYGIQPTEATFISVLTACTHAKMVNEGLKLFNGMSTIYGVKPQREHYACVVDLLARAGMVEEAEKFLEEKMGGLAGWDANVWGALLGACRIYGKVEVGNRVWKKLADMGTADCGAHVLSYNMYKEAGWDMQAKRVRKVISNAGMLKQPGCSVIEVNGVVEEFLAGDLCHPQAQEIFKLLDSFFKMVYLEDAMSRDFSLNSL